MPGAIDPSAACPLESGLGSAPRASTVAAPVRSAIGGLRGSRARPGLTSSQLSTLGLALLVILAVWCLYTGASTALQLGSTLDLRLMLVLAQVGALLLPALVAIAALERSGFVLRPRSTPRATMRTHLGPVLGVGLAGCVVAQVSNILWLSWLHSTGWHWVGTMEDLMRLQYGPLLKMEHPGQAIVALVVVGLVPAVCEETAFRRLFQGLLSSAFSGAVAVGVAAFVFSAFHMDPLGFPSRVFLGISMGVVYHRTGSLLASAIVHGMNNAICVGLASMGLDDPGPLSGSSGEPGPLLVLALVGVAGLLCWLVTLAAIPPRAPALEAVALRGSTSP